jgi:hypothetical protein
MSREWREKVFSENLQALRTHLKRLRSLYPTTKLPIQAIQPVKAGELSGSDVIELVIKLGTHIDLASRDVDFLLWGDDHTHRDHVESILFRKVDFETLDTLETHVKVLGRHGAFLRDSKPAPAPAATDTTGSPADIPISGWLSIPEIIERAGIPKEKAEAFEKALFRARDKKDLPDSAWQEIRDTPTRKPRYLFDLSCPAVQRIVKKYQQDS